MFTMTIISQIVDLKMISKALVLIKCYQCGGETLGPVVKHSVRDSKSELQQIVQFRQVTDHTDETPSSLILQPSVLISSHVLKLSSCTTMMALCMRETSAMMRVYATGMETSSSVSLYGLLHPS